MGRQLGKLVLLFSNELGSIPASQAGAELLLHVIATACERNSLMTTLPVKN